MNEERIKELLDIMHGRIATMEHNSLVGLFDKKLEEIGLDYDNDFLVKYSKISNHLSKEYKEETKEESDLNFIADTILIMEAIMKYADSLD